MLVCLKGGVRREGKVVKRKFKSVVRTVLTLVFFVAAIAVYNLILPYIEGRELPILIGVSVFIGLLLIAGLVGKGTVVRKFMDIFG